ncbi:hypothetical protein DMENIID0001_168540 [Sergentomyia squamirostris]
MNPAKKTAAGAKKTQKRKRKPQYGISDCIVPGCGTTKFVLPELSRHKLPDDDDLRQKWIDSLAEKFDISQEVFNNKKAVVCSLHFQPEDFKCELESGHQMIRRRLHFYAVPEKKFTAEERMELTVKRCMQTANNKKMSKPQAVIPDTFMFPYVFFDQTFMLENGHAKMTCKMCAIVFLSANNNLSKHMEDKHIILRSQFNKKLKEYAKKIVDEYVKQENMCIEHLNHTASDEDEKKEEEPSPDYFPVVKKMLSPSPLPPPTANWSPIFQ